MKKTLTRMIVLSLVVTGPGYADEPVIDVTNLVENAAQTLKQIDQYTKQLEQLAKEIEILENAVTNTLAPAEYVWDQANQTMNHLMGTVGQAQGLVSKYGSLDHYAQKFQNMGTYRQSPCFQAKGCSDAERAKARESDAIGSEAQKDANDAMLRGLDEQQKQIEVDAATLEKLQATATGAKGRMAAIQAANMLASAQAQQLLQLRALLLQQQQAELARAQALADREAKQLAAHVQSTSAKIPLSTPEAW